MKNDNENNVEMSIIMKMIMKNSNNEEMNNN